MKIKAIKRKDILSGASLIAAGILAGALIFASPHQSNQEEATAHKHNLQADTTHASHEDATTWTCSMHPQVRQDEPGDCPICGMELIPAKKTEGDSDPTELKMTEEALKLADIQTSTVQKKIPEKEIRLTGKVEVDQRRVYTQSSHFPGRVEKLYLNFKGEHVKEGQTIASVYSPELIAAQEELLEALETKNSNPLLVEAARGKLRQWKLSKAQIADIEKKGQIREHMKIKANVSGIVHKKMINEGDYINKGSMLYHIAKIDKVWVMFDAYQSDVSLIDEGDRIRFTVPGIPGETFNSTVTFIDPLIDEKSRVAKVRAEAFNQSGLLKPGMFAEGAMNSNNPGSGKELVVPASSVMWTGKRSVVYVKNTNSDRPSFSLREVTLGSSLGDSYIVKQGLKEQEEIVMHGTFAVDAAAQLAGKPSMMNRQQEQSSPAHEHKTMKAEQDRGREGSDRNNEKIAWPASELKAYKNLVKHYLALKSALVNDQKDSNHVERMLEVLASIDMSAFSQASHNEWMKMHEKLTEKGTAISNAGKLDEQRRQFIAFSDAMIELVKTFSLPDERLYVQFCPMANNNNGAFWLSTEEQIRNPYYGNQMLTCGDVREEINTQK